MRTLVTGGAGFIGARLCAALERDGHDVVVLDRLTTGKLDALRRHAPAARLVPGDVADHPQLPQLLSSSEVVFHLAADPDVRSALRDPARYLKEHHDTVARVTSLAREGAVVVFASSSTVYGEPSAVPTPEAYGPCVPISAYGASKLAGEGVMSAMAHTRGLRSASLRFANVVGPGQSHGALVDFAAKLDHDPRRMEVLGDGSQRKSYVDVDDAVSALVLVATRLLDAPPKSSEVYNCGTADAVDVNFLVRAICEAMRVEPELAFRPAEDGRGWKGDVKTMLLECARLRGLSWEPRLDSAGAVRRTAEWLASLRRARAPRMV